MTTESIAEIAGKLIQEIKDCRVSGVMVELRSGHLIRINDIAMHVPARQAPAEKEDSSHE